MRIAWLLPNLHSGGGVRAALELGSRLAQRGHTFYLFVPRGRRKMSAQEGINIIECGPKVKNPLLAVFVGLGSMLFKIPQCDVIIGSMPPYALLARWIGWLRQIPSVNYVLNDDVHFFDDRSFIKSTWVLKVYRFAARRSIRKMLIMTNSHWTATRIVAEGGERPFAIVQSGFEPVQFFSEQIKNPDNKETVLMTVGRRARWKGLTDLITALNFIDKQRFQFYLIIATQENLDLTQANFDYKIIKPEGDGALAALYRRADIFIHPSWFEGFGLPPLEAQACGAAVISTDCGGVREFLTNGENALIVPPRQPRALARAIEKLIEDPELRRRLRERGLETASNWTWERMADKFEHALLSCGH
ncbi:MAG: glycosyltransferase family 4 protein [Calditrichaeota bacterium]|nr:glycosyltransferase family 4 protein [Calditrichota bacterium]